MPPSSSSTPRHGWILPLKDVANIAAWLLGSADPGRVALVDRGRSFLYEELSRRTRQVAAIVRDRVEWRAGDRPIVPLVGENSFELAAAHLGVLYAGAVSAPLPSMTDGALAEVLHDMGGDLAFAQPDQVERLRRLGARRVFALGEDLTVGEAREPREVDPRALALLLYTSGSTAKPRGVMVSAANVMANVNGILEAVPLAADERVMLSLPLCYCYGLSVLHTHLRHGGCSILSAKLYPQEILTEVKAGAVTGLPGVPTLFAGLLERSTLAQETLPHLRYLMVSGGRLGDSTIERLRRALPDAKLYLRYGVTELTAAASCLPLERLRDKLGSIGRGMPGAPLSVEREDGTSVAAGSGEIGEIVARGACVASGYFRDPEETARCFRGGAFFTGDMASVDSDGYLFIVGREREFIKTAGHRVSPYEVEDVIAGLPGVREVGVCAIPHALLGEALLAAVVLEEGCQITEKELRRHCAARLPAPKVPAEFRFVRELPRTSNGKLSRRAIRDMRE